MHRRFFVYFHEGVKKFEEIQKNKKFVGWVVDLNGKGAVPIFEDREYNLFGNKFYGKDFLEYIKKVGKGICLVCEDYKVFEEKIKEV